MKDKEKAFSPGNAHTGVNRVEAGAGHAFCGGREGPGEQNPPPEIFIRRLLRIADEAGAYEAFFFLEKDRLKFSYKVRNDLTQPHASNGSSRALLDELDLIMADYSEPVSLGSGAGGEEGETALIYDLKAGSGTWQKLLGEKLAHLKYPNLFLKNIRKIFYNIGRHKGVYDKRIEYSENFGPISVDLVKMRRSSLDDPGKMLDERLWLFSRETEDRKKYSVGFFIGEDEKLIARSLPLFSVFPTGEQTGLNFVINAPFRCRKNWEGLAWQEKANGELLALAARLAADSLECLKELGIRSDVRLMDNLLDIIPYDPSPLAEKEEADKLPYLAFYRDFLEKLKSASLIPASSGYISAGHAWRTEERAIMKLFSTEALRAMVRDADADWAFPLESSQKNGHDAALASYMDKIVTGSLDEYKILKGSFYADGKKIRFLNAQFIESRPLEWLDRFYKWILEDRRRVDAVKDAPIFLDRQKRARAINEKKLNTPLAQDDVGSGAGVHPELLEFASCRELIDCIAQKM